MSIKTYKVMLVPNNRQNTRLFACAHTARFAYNWALYYEQFAYEIGNDFMSDLELRKIFTMLKKKSEYSWLNDFGSSLQIQAIKDACIAYKNFFEHRAKHPRYKRKGKSKLSFYISTSHIKMTDTHVKLEKLTLDRRASRQRFNWIRLAEKGRIPTGCKYYNPRVSYDGLHWWLTVGVEQSASENTALSPDGIGVDLGIKTLAVCSDGHAYSNINRTSTVKRVEKKRRRLQRQVSRKYIMNKNGTKFVKTSNIIKAEKQLLILNHRLRDIRHTHLHKSTTDIINRKPRFVVLEDLNVMGMLKNGKLARAIQEQCFYEFYRQLEYKCLFKGIPLITADRFFPSSKTCYSCGFMKRDLRLSDRTYICPNCGNTLDRDLQAAKNLERYGLQHLGA